MYQLLKILIPIICIVGIIYINTMKDKYTNDTTSSKEDIIKYFEDNNATSIETGIKTKDLPKFILRSPYRILMVQDKTLNFKKGKYYINR